MSIRHAIAAWQLKTEAAGWYLSEAEAKDLFGSGMMFLKLYGECARRFCARGQVRFLLRPKLHELRLQY